MCSALYFPFLSFIVCFFAFMEQTTDEAFTSTSATQHTSDSGKGLQRPSSPAIQISTPDSPKIVPPRPPPPARANTLPRQSSNKEGEIIIDFPTKKDEDGTTMQSNKPKPAPRTKLSNSQKDSEGAPAIPPKPHNSTQEEQKDRKISSVNSSENSEIIETEISDNKKPENKTVAKDDLENKVKMATPPTSPKAGKGPKTTKKPEKGIPSKVNVVSFLLSVQVHYSCLLCACVV